MKLGDLTESQGKIAMKTMTDEGESFAKNDDDVGCIEGLQLNLELSGTSPVQKTCVLSHFVIIVALCNKIVTLCNTCRTL